MCNLIQVVVLHIQFQAIFYALGNELHLAFCSKTINFCKDFQVRNYQIETQSIKTCLFFAGKFITCVFQKCLPYFSARHANQWTCFHSIFKLLGSLTTGGCKELLQLNERLIAAILPRYKDNSNLQSRCTYRHSPCPHANAK